MFGRFVKLTSQHWPEVAKHRPHGDASQHQSAQRHAAPTTSIWDLIISKETRIVADEHVTHQEVSGLFQRLQTPRSAKKRTPVTVLRLITFSRWSPRRDEEDTFPNTVSHTHARHQTADNERAFTASLFQIPRTQPRRSAHLPQTAQRPHSHEVQTNSNLNRPKHFRTTVTDDCISKGVGPITTTL